MIKTEIMKELSSIVKNIESEDRWKRLNGKASLLILVDDLASTLQDIHNIACGTEKFISE